MTVTEQLKQASSREIGQITSHPWLTAAAAGALEDHQVGAAFGWLDGNMDCRGWQR